MLTNVEELLEAVKLKLPDYLTELGITDPMRKHFHCLSPDHADSTPSMMLHKDGTFIHCFSCGCTYDIFNLVSKLEKKPIDGSEFIKENVRYLADKFGIKYSLPNKSENDARATIKYMYFRAYKVVSEFIVKTAKENPTDAYAKELEKRKWKKFETLKLGVGCVHNYSDIYNLLESHGFSKEFIEISGLFRPDMFNSDGIIFTVKDEFNKPIAFYVRDCNYEDKKKAYEATDFSLEINKPRCPMKFNSTANFVGIYEKVLHPYGLHDIKNCHKVILVEGHGCKHSMNLNGIDNVIALGGLSLDDRTLEKFARLGVTHIVLLLDNDAPGRQKVKSIIEQYFGNKYSVDISVMDIGLLADDIKDADEMLRKYGIDTFHKVKERHALDWLSSTCLNETGDPFTVVQLIAPLIAKDHSPLNRLKVINIISELTHIDKDIISNEVDRKISLSHDRKGEYALKVLDEVREMIQINPESYTSAMHIVNEKLGALDSNDNDEDLYSSTEVLKSIHKMQEKEESDEQEPLIKLGFEEFDRLVQLPTSEAFGLIMGPPNTGKSSFFINGATGAVMNDPDLMVLILTIDDSRDVYLNRFVASMTKLTMNWLRRPSFYLDEEKSRARSEAYRTISEWVMQDRLIIKDVTHKNTVEYLGKLIRRWREKHPKRKLLVMCDNLHKLDSDCGLEGKDKYKYISSQCKSFTTKYDCAMLCTVEMTKQDMYEKPKDARTISETASLQFDANLIIFLWNEINALRENAKLVFDGTTLEYIHGTGYVHKPIVKPIIEALVLKNKLSQYKGSLYFKFHPELAIYENIGTEEVTRLMEEMEKRGKDKKDDDS